MWDHAAKIRSYLGLIGFVMFLVFPCSLGYSVGVLLQICEFSKGIQLFGNLIAEAAVDWWPETTRYLGPICWGSLADVTLLRWWLWQLVAQWVSDAVPVQGTGRGQTCDRRSVRLALGHVP
jgi:hypothetical protein